MSLADELLADLEEDGPSIRQEEEDEEPEDIDDIEDVGMEVDIKQGSVRQIAKLVDSEEVRFL